MANVARGHAETPSSISASASRGDGGSCGHHHCTSGRCSRIQAAIWRALVDCGDERKPCRYSRWLSAAIAAPSAARGQRLQQLDVHAAEAAVAHAKDVVAGLGSGHDLGDELIDRVADD